MTAVLVLLAAGSVVLLEARAATVTPPPGWSLMVKRPPARLFVAPDGNGGVCLDANAASFSINRETHVDLQSYPILTWTWRADVLPPLGDFRHAVTDDQAAQLFVLFARHGIGARQAINYIWDTNAEVGEGGDFSIPFVVAVKTVVVKQGTAEAGRWVTLRRDVRRDYAELFGGPGRAVEAIRFQVNSQHTGARAIGCLREVSFVR